MKREMLRVINFAASSAQESKETKKKKKLETRCRPNTSEGSL